MNEAKPISKIDIYQRGMRGLDEILGTVDAETFIAMVKSENLDYTEWRRQHYGAMTTDEIKQDIREYLKTDTFNGNAAAVV